MSAHFRKETDRPDTVEPTIPTPEPTENPDEWITCNHCSQRFISTQNARGIAVRARDPNTSYYVAEDVANIYHRDNGVGGFLRIRADNQETDLVLTRAYCFTCQKPAGWKVLQRSESHPIVDVEDFLLYVPRPPLPPPFLLPSSS